MKELKEFLLRGNLVELAVAVVLGVAFTAVVTSFVEDLLTPLIAAVAGEPDFSRLTFTVNGSVFRYGEFINAVLSFLVVASVLYFLVVKPVNAALARRRPAGDEIACPYCLSSIPRAARRCSYCTSDVTE